MNQAICQSCGMPMVKDTDFGTDKDGNRQGEFCHYCFQAGGFTNPNLTLEEQIAKQAHMAMSRQAISEKDAYAQARKVLPNLKRWQTEKQEPSAKQKKFVMIAMTVAIIFGAAVTIISKKTKGGGSSDSSDEWAAVSMIPIWIAVFIPAMAAKKKKIQKKGETIVSKDQLKKKHIINLVIALLVLIIAVYVALYLNN